MTPNLKCEVCTQDESAMIAMRPYRFCMNCTQAQDRMMTERNAFLVEQILICRREIEEIRAVFKEEQQTDTVVSEYLLSKSEEMMSGGGIQQNADTERIHAHKQAYPVSNEVEI